MTKATLECGSCGSRLTGPKFCGECGAPVASPKSVAEYKQVTVLFADVVHSMDIAAAVGAERLREIMAELFDRSSAVVKRYGGTVDKFTGDGIMAVFGAPITLEDHAIRACIAALEIQNQTTVLAADVKNRDGIVLQLRVGLNSGQVIAGEIGSRDASYTAVGEQVGMAQRMESVAPPGGVMLSESTARLVENAVLLGEDELHRIKGADSPVRARQLLAIEEHQARHRSESTLVGRGTGVELSHRGSGRGRRRRRMCRQCRRASPASAKADWLAKSPHSRRAGEWQSSPHTANPIPAMSRSVRSRDCFARAWGSMIISMTLPPEHRSAIGSSMQTMKTYFCLMTCWALPTQDPRCPTSHQTPGGAA